MAIDAARGAVMVIMALDHVRDFIHREAMLSSPTDLAQTTVPLFQDLIRDPDIINGEYNIHWLEHWLARKKGF